MKKKISIEDALISGLKDARDYEHGKKKLNSKERELPAPAPEFKKNEIKDIRKKVLYMTQEQFAQALNVAVGTIRSWEQGARNPEKASNRLLQIVKQNPNILRGLKSA